MTRVIQIGVGHFGRAWREALTTTPEVQVVGLVDIRARELEEGAAFFGVPHEHCFDDAYGDWTAVEADLVIDSTPHMFHYENAIRAFRCGKDVIVVKPMSDRWEGARAMVREAERWGRKLHCSERPWGRSE
jgi:predicted dehydrogenase